MVGLLIGLLLAIVTFSALARNDLVGMEDARIYVTAFIFILAGTAFVSLFIGRKKISFERVLIDAVKWSLVLQTSMVLIAHRDAIRQGAINLLSIQSHSVPEGKTGEVIISQKADNHFFVMAKVKDTPMRFMVDTGSSMTSLSKESMRSLGINPDDLNYNVRILTAGGVDFAAEYLLPRFAIEDIEVRNLRVLIPASEELKENLLGMNFLSGLKSFEFSQNYLVLRQ